MNRQHWQHLQNALYTSVAVPTTRKYFAFYVAQLRANATGFLVGGGPTIADLFLADYLHTVHTLAPALFDGEFAALDAYKCRILTLPAIRSYIDGRPRTPL